jgi:small subunit ribosomal protein S2
MEKKTLSEMFEANMHIGNKSNYRNPKVKDYIYGASNGVHVINLVKTADKIETLKAALTAATKEGKKVLIVATKLQVKDAFVKLAIDTGSFYVSEKWVPGLLTNFKTIKKRIATYIKLSEDLGSGALDVLTKKEKAVKMLELEKLDKSFKWLKEMNRVPEIVFVVDGVFEAQALKEASILGLTSYQIINTNWDIDSASDFALANTNSTKAMAYLASIFSGSIVKGAKREASATVRMDAPKNWAPTAKTFVKKADVKPTEEAAA